MRIHLLKIGAAAAAAVTLASTAQAQGRKHDNDRHRDHRAESVHRPKGDIWRGERRAVPPGLAKKPGHMPPGQYKKVYRHYDTAHGASVLSDIFRRRGYRVDRVTPYNDSRYVYYRTRDGALHRAIVSQGPDRLRFSNVPSSLLEQVLAALY
jgi:hypothetical protein